MAPRNRSILIGVSLAVICTGVVWLTYRSMRAFGPMAAPQSAVSARDIIPSGPAKDGMPAITDPSFVSVPAADQILKEEGLGIDVATGGKRRFYPFQILVWHVAVNDMINGKPALITFCPLCQDGGVYDRSLNGVALEFGTAGKVWNSSTLLYDKTGGTLWTASGMMAVEGSLAGTRLAPMPSRVMSWNAWKRAYPDGLVLAREPGGERDYTLDPYGTYATDRNILFPIVRPDERVPVKSVVFGLMAGGESAAYRADDVTRMGELDDTVGGVPVALWPEANSGVAGFDRRVSGRTLTFFRSKDGSMLDHETGSAWNRDGVAIAGTLKKSRLTSIPLDRSFWYCWAGEHPETKLYKLP